MRAAIEPQVKNRVFVAACSRDEKKARKMQLPFSVADIIHSPVETFNDMLTKYKLSEAQLQLMKDIRRRGKNKVSLVRESSSMTADTEAS